MAEIRMPKMGDGMEEGTILRWIKQEGETVGADEPIAEIETDKANVEMTAEEAGTLTRIIVKEGETVPVGAVIAFIGEAGDSATNGSAPAVVVESPSMSPAPSSISPREPETAASGPAAERVKASPLARKMAQEMGIDLAQVQGSGPGGRIVERDIAAFREKSGAASLPLSMTAGPSPIPPPSLVEGPGVGARTSAPVLAGQDADTSRMRKAIARRTVHSKQTVPHFYITMPIEMDRAMNLLAEMNADQAPEQKITVNDLIVKACAVALTALPEVNVSWTTDDRIRHYTAINIGIAVPTDEGLTVPVLPDCGAKSLRQISAEAKALVGKARGGTITPQEMSGGTFSVSNMGMFGVEEFAAIINPPESAILAVGAVAPEVMAAEDGSFVARRRMRVTLSCDHRTVDGLLGAKFLQALKRLLESPFSLLA